MIVGVDHIGIAVTTIKEARKLYHDAFGFEIEEMEPDKALGIKIGWVNMGNVKIELMEPVDPAGKLAKFLETRGEGLHHIALKVKDIEGELQTLKKNGIALVDEKPRQGGHGGKVAYVHPKGARGVSVQLLEP